MKNKLNIYDVGIIALLLILVLGGIYSIFFGEKKANTDHHEKEKNTEDHAGKANPHHHQEATHKFFDDLNKMLKETKGDLDVAQGKECVVLIGQTGVGKSTLANAIAHGSDILEEKDSALVTKAGTHEILFDILSERADSATYPEVVAINDKQVLVECPGFNIKGGEDENLKLMSCIAISKLLQNANKVRLCLLISENEITHPINSQVLTGLLKELIQLLNSPEHLQKVQIVVARLEGRTSKDFLKKMLKSKLKSLLSSNESRSAITGAEEEAITAIVENVLLVDAADRSSQFKKVSWFSSSSEDQTTVADLKEALFNAEADKWLAPNDFVQTIMTVNALRELREICCKIEEETIHAIQSNEENYEAKAAAQIALLNKFKAYEPKGSDSFVDMYIKTIENVLGIYKRT